MAANALRAWLTRGQEADHRLRPADAAWLIEWVMLSLYSQTYAALLFGLPLPTLFACGLCR